MLIGVDWHSSEMASFLATTELFIVRHPGFFRGTRWETRNDEPVVVGMRVGMPGVDA
jgi:hypothetical protein